MNQLRSPKTEDTLVAWLLTGDVSIQYQVHRDLLGTEREDLRERIANEGWGARFLSQRNKEGHWGDRFYQPKWTSTHYTILDLKNLSISPTQQQIQESIAQVLAANKAPDGGINPIGTIKKSDVCINGMFLNYATYFGADEQALRSIVDYLLVEHMADGGFNCQSNRKGAIHSSMHSTISVLEGILEYAKNGYTYRLAELQQAQAQAQAFLLQHHLFRSDRTGKIINKKMTMLSYPSRWKYDILRALDYFQFAKVNYDPRMEDALALLRQKRRKDSKWPHQAKHPGQVHFNMEAARTPSRWNTLRALRVLNWFKV